MNAVTVRHLVEIPGVPGPDLHYPSARLAQREAANARRAAHEARVREVLVRSK